MFPLELLKDYSFFDKMFGVQMVFHTLMKRSILRPTGESRHGFTNYVVHVIMQNFIY